MLKICIIPFCLQAVDLYSLFFLGGGGEEEEEENRKKNIVFMLLSLSFIWKAVSGKEDNLPHLLPLCLFLSLHH